MSSLQTSFSYTDLPLLLQQMAGIQVTSPSAETTYTQSMLREGNQKIKKDNPAFFDQVDLDEALQLYSVVRKLKPENTLEIGFCCASSRLAILQRLEDNGSGKHDAVNFFAFATNTFFCLFIVTVFAKGSEVAETVLSYSLGLLTFLIAYVYRSYIKHSPPTKFLAQISYSLYVSHSLLGYVLIRAIIRRTSNPTIATATAFCVALAVATILYYLVENQRKILESNFLG